jgi:hypothetical protein
MKQKLLLKLKGAVQPSKIILILLEKHHELKSLISNEQISFPQPSKGSKSVLDVYGVRFSCPKKQ